MPHIHELYDYTTSAFILHPTEQKLCLLLHNKIGKWLQPGGHVELNENPWQALTHEILEETGLELKKCEVLLQPEMPSVRGNTSFPIPFHFNEHPMGNLPSHTHIDICYLIRSNTTELTKEPDGASKIAWFNEQEIEDIHNTGDMFDATYDLCKWVLGKTAVKTTL